MKRFIINIFKYINPPEGVEGLKYWKYKIYFHDREYRLRVRRLPFGLWRTPTVVLASHGLRTSVTHGRRPRAIIRHVCNGHIDKEVVENSLSDWAELMKSYKKSHPPVGVDRGSVFDYKIIDEL